jgi:lactoylglutathione lyase
MGRIVHIALKVEDLETATKFYEDVFGIYQIKTGHARGHTSRHMTDGNIDVALMVYDSEDEPEAKLAGAGPCIHHFGIEVEDRDATMKKIVENGGEIFSDKEEGALKFRAPDGNMAEIVGVGRYKKKRRARNPASSISRSRSRIWRRRRSSMKTCSASANWAPATAAGTFRVT